MSLGSDFSGLSLGPGPSTSTAAADCFGTRAGMQIGLGATIRGSGHRVRSAVGLPVEISLIEECVASEEEGNSKETVDVREVAMGFLSLTGQRGGKMSKKVQCPSIVARCSHCALAFEENAKQNAVGNTAHEPRKRNEKQEAAGDVRSREALGGEGAALSRSLQSVDDVLTWLGKLKLPLRDLARYQVYHERSFRRLFITNVKGTFIRMSESGEAS